MSQGWASIKAIQSICPYGPTLPEPGGFPTTEGSLCPTEHTTETGVLSLLPSVPPTRMLLQAASFSVPKIS